MTTTKNKHTQKYYTIHFSDLVAVPMKGKFELVKRKPTEVQREVKRNTQQKKTILLVLYFYSICS